MLRRDVQCGIRQNFDIALTGFRKLDDPSGDHFVSEVDAPGFFPFVGNPTCGPHVRHSGAELEAGEVLAATLAARMKYPCFGNSVRALSVSACMGGPATRQGGTP